MKAIEAGIYHDLGSGSNVDVCVIQKGKKEFFRTYVSKNHKMFSMEKAYVFPPGTTSITRCVYSSIEVLKESVVKLADVRVEDVSVPMESL